MEAVKLEKFDAMSKEQMKKVEGGIWGALVETLYNILVTVIDPKPVAKKMYANGFDPNHVGGATR